MSKQKPPVRFEVGDPIIGLLATKEQIAEIITDRINEDRTKLLALCDFYGINQNGNHFYNLALILARELYPKNKKTGRTKWTYVEGGYLVVEVERLQQQKENRLQMTIPRAASILARKKPWLSLLGGEPNHLALMQQFKKYKKHKFTKLTRDCFKYHELLGLLQKWDEMVMQCEPDNDF